MKEIHSRHLDKRRNRVTSLLGGDRIPGKRLGPLYWAPRSLMWWTGTLFMIGSLCFAVGPVLTISGSTQIAAVIFFVGSIFFTTAAYSQFLAVINAESTGTNGVADRQIRLFAIERDLTEWKACSIQLVGTLSFNVTTFAGMLKGLDATSAKHLVWAPDAFGSFCFLVASWLALSVVRRSWNGRPERGMDWSIAVLNLAGSIAFGISAIGAYVIPDTGELLNAVANNLGTFVGAVCFFVAAYMLWSEAARTASSPSTL